jgi:NAD(P)-dependent dehydrogenase (short-subunit alcohol dehydrogenase family)
MSRVMPEYGGELHYRQQDVSDTAHLDSLIADIAAENERLDGVVAAAGVQRMFHPPPRKHVTQGN